MSLAVRRSVWKMLQRHLGDARVVPGKKREALETEEFRMKSQVESVFAARRGCVRGDRGREIFFKPF